VLLLSLPAIVFANVQIQNGNMSADLNSEQLSNVLEAVQQQTGIKVSVDPAVGSQPISASFQNLPFAAGIKKLLEGTGINYVVIGDEQGAMSLFVGTSEKPGEAQGKTNPGAAQMPGRGVVQPVNPMPSVPPPPPATGKPDNQKKNQNAPPAVSVPTGGGFTPNTGNNNNPDQNQQQQQIGRPPIPPEEQAPEDDENEDQPPQRF